MQYIRQGATQLIMFGPFVSKTDGVTLLTDATTITDIDHATTGIFVSKNGAAAAIRHQNVTASVADAYGMMKVTLDATDTGTVGTLDVLFAKAATYLPVHKSFQVVDTVVYDALYADAAIGALTGVTLAATQTGVTIPTVTTVTAPVTVTGTVDADVKKVNGVSVVGNGISDPMHAP